MAEEKDIIGRGVTNCHTVINGVPQEDHSSDDDFIMPCTTGADLLETYVDICVCDLPENHPKRLLIGFVKERYEKDILLQFINEYEYHYDHMYIYNKNTYDELLSGIVILYTMEHFGILKHQVEDLPFYEVIPSVIKHLDGKIKLPDPELIKDIILTVGDMVNNGIVVKSSLTQVEELTLNIIGCYIIDTEFSIGDSVEDMLKQINTIRSIPLLYERYSLWLLQLEYQLGTDTGYDCLEKRMAESDNGVFKLGDFMVLEEIPAVNLSDYNGISVIDNAIGMCWDKHSRNINHERMKRVITENKHESVSEHVLFNFAIDNISRAALQELARHRMASLSVKSSRYTLKELKNEIPFYDPHYTKDELQDGVERAATYLVSTLEPKVDTASIKALEELRKIIASGISNDKAKYAMPEAYKTQLAWSINIRSLRNFLELRTSPAALFELRRLALAIYKELPDEFKFLLWDKVYKPYKY